MMQLQSNLKHVCRSLHGGTLLEVLVGLVILALVLTSVVDAMGQNRRAQTDVQWHNLACHLAMHWRQGRLAHNLWTQGDQGTFDTFEGSSHYRWRLETVAVPDASIQPDAPWRKLIIQDSISPISSEFLVRIQDLQPLTKEERP